MKVGISYSSGKKYTRKKTHWKLIMFLLNNRFISEKYNVLKSHRVLKLIVLETVKCENPPYKIIS